MFEVICEVIFGLCFLIFTIVLLLFITGLFSTYHSYTREREWFFEEFISATRSIRSLKDKLEKMNEELEKTEKELTALIDNK